ncbi:hypothetical protein LY78DRAFT_708496 [Colletotrichum sublineola]|nr:hypothetical protein LY78DRAFT_708496 [Colletotrichum sublineola]
MRAANSWSRSHLFWSGTFATGKHAQACGPSWAQAEAAGCIYDLILSAWQNNVVSWNQALSGRHPEEGLWTDGGFHHFHCSYAWDRQRRAYARARATGQPLMMDTFSRNETHTSHCIYWNAHPNPWERVEPNITHIYPLRQPIRCLVGY